MYTGDNDCLASSTRTTDIAERAAVWKWIEHMFSPKKRQRWQTFGNFFSRWSCRLAALWRRCLQRLFVLRRSLVFPITRAKRFSFGVCKTSYLWSTWTHIFTTLTSWHLHCTPLLLYIQSTFSSEPDLNIAGSKSRRRHLICLCSWALITKPPNLSLYSRGTQYLTFSWTSHSNLTGWLDLLSIAIMINILLFHACLLL